MKVGAYVFATDQVMDPGELAVEVEQRGLDSLFFPEHSHIPVARDTAYPEAYGGGILPEFYQRTYDPFISCSFAAATTSRIQVAPGIALLALRDAVHTAKMAASIDRLSNGRFVLGVGFGWNADEYPTHGADFTTRHRKVREQVEALRQMWRDDIVEFHGEFVDFAPSWMYPKPVDHQVPIYLGGSGPRTMRHAAEWADVWYPTPPLADPLLERSVPEFMRMVEATGRDPDSVGVGCAPAACDAAALEAYQANGVAHVNIYVGGDTRDETLQQLDAVLATRTAVLGEPAAA